MLQAIRKSVTSWIGILILTLALGALVITLFQPTGPTGGTTASGPVMATVGDRAVTEAEFIRTVDRAVARERERSPGITVPDFLGAGGGDMVLQQLIAGRAIDVFASRNRMAVSKAQVDGEIASIAAFQTNGNFDEAKFRRLLAEQRLTEAELREGIATDILRRQLLMPVGMGTTMPRGMAEPFANLLLEVRRGFILPVPTLALPDPGEPTLDQLKAFHAENRQTYTLPERRVFRFAELDLAALTARAKPDAATVRKYYDDNPQEFGGLEQREVVQLVLRDQAAARAAVAAIRGGQSFDAVARAQGFAPEDIALGLVNRDQLANQTTGAVADAAFALKPGDVSDPVLTSLGFHLLQVRRIVPARPQPFEAVAAGIEERLTAERLQDLIADTVAKAEDRFAAGASLNDVAAELGLAVQTSPALTADGRLFDSDFRVSRVERPELSKVFQADESDGPQVADLGGNRFTLFELTEVIQPALVPLEDIREDVALAWRIDTRVKAARAEAERIAAALGRGETLAAAVGRRALPPPQPLQVRRLELTQMAQQGQPVPPPVVLMLNTPQGQARVAPAPQGQGFFVVKVDAIEPGNAAGAPDLVDAVRQSLQAEAANEMMESFVRAIQRDVGVVEKPAQVKATTRRLTGMEVD